MNRNYLENGLNNCEISERVSKGLTNIQDDTYVSTNRDIIISSVFTLFNLINIFLAFMVAITGQYRNMLFILVVISNAFIAIFQRIRSKNQLLKLRRKVIPKISVIRNGAEFDIDSSEAVIDDLMILKPGSKVECDGIIIDGECYADESMLTGESLSIFKQKDDEILSGSYILSGVIKVKVTKVGRNSYMNMIESRIIKEKIHPSAIRDTLDKIIRCVTFAIVPLSLLIFFKQYYISGISFNDAINQTAAGAVGMIPEGLVLLVSVTLSIGCLNLARKNTLVQEMYSLETLARTDVLCLDKTGTITSGHMKVYKTIGINTETASIIGAIYHSLESENATAKAISSYFNNCSDIKIDKLFEFSSKEKFCGALINGSLYKIGAPEYIVSDYRTIDKTVDKFAKEGYRVLAITKDSICLGMIILEEELRSNALKVIDFFNRNSTSVKIISGDNPLSVSITARKAGVLYADRYLDCRDIDDETLKDMALLYTVFGRVSPDQKCILIKAIKNAGHTVGMIGDGVNDTLALKEADLSISFNSAADSARCISDIILVDDDFDHIIDIIKEGRRVINNITRTATLFLTKTILSALLVISTMFFMSEYPFMPIQMTLISTVCIGIPSFILSLEPDYSLIRDSFFRNIISRSLPSAISIVLSGFILEILSSYGIVNPDSINTIYIMFTFSSFISNIISISKPLNPLRSAVISFSIITFLGTYIFFGDIFYLRMLSEKDILTALLMISLANMILYLISNIKIKNCSSI